MISLGLLATVLKTAHKIAGTLIKGKLTNSGIAVGAVGLAITAIKGENPFESARVIIDLCEKAWPHALVVAGALGALMGYLRKAGADAVKTVEN